MPALYINVPADIHAWIARQAEEGRTTQSAIASALLAETMRRGWSVEGGQADRVKVPE
jgi:hypothetical protein